MDRSWAKLILPAVLIFGGTAWCMQSRLPGGSTAGSASGAAASGMPLLGGLQPGDVIDEWTVDRILVNKAPNESPQLAVELVRKGSGITVWVARKETTTGAPIVTERYAISHGHARPYGEPIPEDSYGKMAARVAERVRNNETTAPVPEGL